MSLNKSWRDYNESLIERGRVLIDLSFLESRNESTEAFNGPKEDIKTYH